MTLSPLAGFSSASISVPSVPLVTVAEVTPLVGLLTLCLAGVLLSSATASGKVREFFAENGVLMLVGAVMVAAIVGIYLFFTADRTVAEQWLAQYGLVALFLILILEGAMLLYFAPSEILVPTGVTLIADSIYDWETIAVIIFVAVVGATIGQYGLFLLAKRGGREYLLEKKWFRVDEPTLDRFDGWFQKWGRVIVPISNAFLFTRGMLTVPAGLAEMRDWEFIVLSAIGTFLFQSWLTILLVYLADSGYLGALRSYLPELFIGGFNIFPF